MKEKVEQRETEGIKRKEKWTNNVRERYNRLKQ
jgi:hypothetical protein